MAQRNIHVVGAAQASGEPLQIHVGPLFGAAAMVRVERVMPTTMPWLQLRTGIRGQFPLAAPTGTPIVSAPHTIGTIPNVTGGGQSQHVTGDDQQVLFTSSDDLPGAGQAHVYRVTANQRGAMVGGYPIVVLGG